MPHLEHARIDLDSISDEFDRQVMINIATRHNALVDASVAIKADLDGISGVSKDEKAIAHAAFKSIRWVASYVHNKRYPIALITLQAFGILSVLQKLGIDTELVKKLVDFYILSHGV